jgi:aryl-alcohol dehydrogenase-like predicted oxidoreductase
LNDRVRSLTQTSQPLGAARSFRNERKHVTLGQLALAWVLAKGDDFVPIPGTKRRKYLEENAAAADIVLNDAEVAELQATVPPEEVAGERYTAASAKHIDR